MTILKIALLAASLATTPAAAFADVAPEGHTQPQIASYSAPEGQTPAQVASYKAPEGQTQPQIG
jgi:hypothetical protein